MLRKDERYYYGWVIVLVMSVSNAVTMGMGSLNFGLYIKPMGDDLVIKKAAKSISLIHPQNYDYFDNLKSKLLWGKDKRHE